MRCGHCRACSRGQDTYCENAATMPYLAVGLGRDGGMAEYVSVPARNLVPLGDADPTVAAPLADAGLTPYHAIKKSLPVLSGGGTQALVIGLGGLGQVAVQILTALTGATVIATDTQESAMERARANGAVTVAGGEGQVDRIREATGGHGVDAVLDFVRGGPDDRARDVGRGPARPGHRGRHRQRDVRLELLRRPLRGRADLLGGRSRSSMRSSTSTGPAGSRRTSRSSRSTTHWRPTAVWNPAS